MKKFTQFLESRIFNNPNQIDDNVYYFNNMSENEFNVFNKGNLYTILKPSEIRNNSKIYSDVLKKENFKNIICSIGIVSFDEMFKNSSHYDFLQGSYRPDKKGIIFFKKRNLDLTKKYDNIRDLNNPNIGLFIKKETNEIHIIIYEIDKFNNPISTLARKSILFYSVISTGVDVPFGGSKIIKTVSRKDVNGQKIMYPFAVYFADNSIIVSDRAIVSQLAKKVWKDFFSQQNVLIPFAPLDNKMFPLTPQKEDDSKVYSSIKKDLELIIKQKFNGNNRKFLLKILESQNENDILKIEDLLPNDIKLLVKNLYESDQKINPAFIHKFLYDLIIDHFKINLSDIRETNYLDWAYKINPSIKSIIKDLFTDLINNHLLVEVSDRNKKLLEYSNDLWSSTV